MSSLDVMHVVSNLEKVSLYLNVDNFCICLESIELGNSSLKVQLFQMFCIGCTISCWVLLSTSPGSTCRDNGWLWSISTQFFQNYLRLIGVDYEFIYGKLLLPTMSHSKHVLKRLSSFCLQISSSFLDHKEHTSNTDCNQC